MLICTCGLMESRVAGGSAMEHFRKITCVVTGLSNGVQAPLNCTVEPLNAGTSKKCLG